MTIFFAFILVTSILGFALSGSQNTKNIYNKHEFVQKNNLWVTEINENEIDAKFIQIIYLMPFSSKIKDEISRARKILIVENNSTSPLSSLIGEKTQIVIDDRNKILRYDARPFLSDELAIEIKKRLK